MKDAWRAVGRVLRALALCVVVVPSCMLALPSATALLGQESTDEARVTIQGKVVDNMTGEPIAGVTVRIGTLSIDLATDQGGAFTLDRVPLGTYFLELSHSAYQASAGDLRVLRDGEFVTSMQPLDDRSEYLVTGVIGIVGDQVTGQPVRGAAVRVSSDMGRVAHTDARGRFSLTDLGAGRHVIEISQLGFASRIDTVSVSPGRVTRVSILLSADPLRLAPLEVSVERREVALQDAGFYGRVGEGFGEFIDRTEIDQRRPSEMSDLFVSLPGVEVFGDPDNPGSRYIVLRSGRQISFSDRNQRCFPRLVIDGLPVHRGGDEPLMLDRLVDPVQVAGLEVYSTSAGVPAQFAGIGSACGLILIWTRR